MNCRIHREKRHPSCCKWCRADTSGRIPLAPSELARQGQIVFGLESVSAVPPVEDLKSRRASRRKRILSARGVAVAALVLIACGVLGSLTP